MILQGKWEGCIWEAGNVLMLFLDLSGGYMGDYNNSLNYMFMF